MDWPAVLKDLFQFLNDVSLNKNDIYITTVSYYSVIRIKMKVKNFNYCIKDPIKYVIMQELWLVMAAQVVTQHSFPSA